VTNPGVQGGARLGSAQRGSARCDEPWRPERCWAWIRAARIGALRRTLASRAVRVLDPRSADRRAAANPGVQSGASLGSAQRGSALVVTNPPSGSNSHPHSADARWGAVRVRRRCRAVRACLLAVRALRVEGFSAFGAGVKNVFTERWPLTASRGAGARNWSRRLKWLFAARWRRRERRS